MHPGSRMFVGFGFGGFFPDEEPTKEFENVTDCLQSGDDQKVLTKDGKIIDYKDDDTETKYFRAILENRECYGFVIGDFDTVATLNMEALYTEAKKWLPYAQKIGKKYGITMETGVHIISFME